MKSTSTVLCILVLILVGTISVLAEPITSTLYRSAYAPAETVQWELALDHPIKEPQAKDFSHTQGSLKVGITPFLKKIDTDKD